MLERTVSGLECEAIGHDGLGPLGRDSNTGRIDGSGGAARGQRASHDTRRRFEGCHIPNVPPRGGSASAAGDEGDDDVGGVAVEVLAAPVVDRGGAGVGVAGGDLDVSQRHAGVEGGHDERGAQHVRVHGTEPGALADRTDPAMRGAPVEALAVTAPQDRAFVAFTDGQVDRPRGSGHERDRSRACCPCPRSAGCDGLVRSRGLRCWWRRPR